MRSAMFLRKTERRKDGKTHLYWSVVENRRLDSGRVVQRHVLYLGEINSSQAEAWRRAIEVFDQDEGRSRTLALFPEDRCEASDDDVIRLRLNEMRLRRPRQWGACWLAGVLWRELRLDRFWAERLPRSRKGTRWDQVLQVLATYRLIAPGSEWRLHRQWFLDSAMADLLGGDFGLAEAHKLYACHDRLIAHKQALFSHLTERWRDLFNASFDVLLYDLTSTYFEINASDLPEGSKRRHGYSRDKRPDCPQLVIALVVTPEGLPLAYEVLPGNTAASQDAAVFPRQGREPIRQGAARVGDGPRRSDRGGPGRDARPRSARPVSGRDAQRTPDPPRKATRRQAVAQGRAKASRSSSCRRTTSFMSTPKAPIASPRSARCAAASSNGCGRD